MFRTFINLVKCSLYLSIAGLVGYYNFGVSGVLGLITNIVFFAIGVLLVLSWKSPEKSSCDHNSEKMSLEEIDTNAVAVEGLDMTDKSHQF
jgi:hypothetical protein